MATDTRLYPAPTEVLAAPALQARVQEIRVLTDDLERIAFESDVGPVAYLISGHIGDAVRKLSHLLGVTGGPSA
jgi:hypothetical protein